VLEQRTQSKPLIDVEGSRSTLRQSLVQASSPFRNKQQGLLFCEVPTPPKSGHRKDEDWKSATQHKSQGEKNRGARAERAEGRRDMADKYVSQMGLQTRCINGSVFGGAYQSYNLHAYQARRGKCR